MSSKPNFIEINGRRIGPGEPTYIIAEMSGNHNQRFDDAVKIIQAAKEAGADAVKLQTYTADSLTIRSDQPYFRVGKGTLWEGRTLHDLYGEAYTPWDWQPRLQAVANDLGLDLFSTPFDSTAVDFLEEMNIPAYKIASFEIIDLPLIQLVAQIGKPIIVSTGMASLAEIDEAVRTIRNTGNEQIVLLKCNSAYPAPPEEMNLITIPHLSQVFEILVGLSDHTLGIEVSIASVTLGACIIEKHFTLSRSIPGPDSAFSLEPHEFKAMVDAVRTTEKALGSVRFGVSEHEAGSYVFRRSLFVVQDVKSGEVFTNENVRSIRPGHGLAPKHHSQIIGRRAARDIPQGTPLAWDMLAGE
jgi:N-acetylneuraminate synthase